MADIEKNTPFDSDKAPAPAPSSAPPSTSDDSSAAHTLADDSNATTVITKPAAPSIGPPPDGGAHAWMTVAGSFLAVFVQFGIANSFGVFQAYYEHHFLSEYQSQDISWIGGVQQFLLFTGGLFSGRALDAYGGHAVFIPGSVLLVLSLMLTSLCTKYYQFMLTQGVLFGLGSGLVFGPAFTIPSQWFAKRRALASAIAVSGSGLGGTLWPIIFNRLFTEVGFPWALRIAGFISLALLAVANALVRTRLPRRKPSPLKDMLKPFKEKTYALLTLGLMISAWSMFNPFFYVSVNAQRLGASTSLAFYCISFLNAGSTVGRLFAGIADRWGRLNVLAGAQISVAIWLLAFWTTLNSVPALIVFAVTYGFLVGFVISLIAPAIAEISPPHEIGARVGLGYTGCAVFVLTGPVISGSFITSYPGHAGWQYMGVFSGLVSVVGVILVLLARFSVNRKIFAVA